MELDSIRFEGGTCTLSDWELFKVTGKDALKFFQGQTTNDLNSLESNGSVLTCRLKRTGQIVSFFYFAKLSDFYLMFIPSKLAQITIEDLQKFIIMEDLEITPFLKAPKLLITPMTETYLSFYNPKEFFQIKIFGEDGFILWGENLKKETSFLPIPGKDISKLQILSGFPTIEEILIKEKILNETYLNEIAASYKKGCFLGQETVAKIQNFRGAAYFPVLLKMLTPFEFDNKMKFEKFQLEGRNGGEYLDFCEFEKQGYLKVSLFRDFRIEGKILEFENFKAQVMYFPFFKENTKKEKAQDLFHRAVDFFKNNDETHAIDLLERSIAIDKTFPDSYESLGVIYGRQGDYPKAIEIMDKLLFVDPLSIMAHTNKSLYLMKLGRIEEAEAEKEKATVKTFERLGKESKDKREAQERKNQEEAQLKRREGMFQEVLEMDPDDTIANFGMADIFFKKTNYSQAKKHLEKIIEKDPKYSNAYLLLGKVLEELKDIAKAVEIYKKGIEVASKKGDLMPANEMQSRLSKLS